MYKNIFIILICVALAACGGFKLRGNLEIPQYLKTVYITPYDPYEPLQVEVRARLRNENVKILDKSAQNVARLELSKPTSGQENLAYGPTGEVQRYRLSVSVAFKFKTYGKDGFELNRTITRTRELNRTSNALLSNEGEEQVVKSELLREVVSELLRQITTRPRYKEAEPSSSTTVHSPC